MSQLAKQEIRLTAVSELRHHPKNPKKGDVETIGESIEENGFYGTIVAQVSTRYVLVGNHRLIAAKEQGLDSLPVAWVECDDATANRILAADNRTGERGSYDNRLLADLLSEISNSGDGLAGTGYVGADLDRLIESLTPPEVLPSSSSSQGKLDETNLCTCPECGHQFSPKK